MADANSMRQWRRGFTLIELMVVVSIIGILASIAIPKMSNLIRRAQEGQTKGSLGTLRSALSIYYSDMEGQFPSWLPSLTDNGKYLTAIPAARTPNYHSDSSGWRCTTWPPVLNMFTEYGGWNYDCTPDDAGSGSIEVNCSHTDSRGTVWTFY